MIPAHGADPDEDWALIHRIGRGDQAALERLYKRYHGYLARVIQRITRRAEHVDEVINEVMFIVWQKAAETVPSAKASTWIFGIAHNKALQSLSRGRPIAGWYDADEDEIEQISDGEATLRSFETDDLALMALQALTPEQRAVMELVYYHGLHYSEIAEIMDCPENTVKTRMFHARKKLRSLWPSLTGQPLAETTAT